MRWTEGPVANTNGVWRRNIDGAGATLALVAPCDFTNEPLKYSSNMVIDAGAMGYRVVDQQGHVFDFGQDTAYFGQSVTTLTVVSSSARG
jgi:hypothetical protein